MIVDAFLTALRDAVYGDSVTMPTHIAIGTGTTAATASDTALETEVVPDGTNRSAISSRTKPSAKSVRVQMIVGVGEANGESLTELGASNAATAGTLTNHIVHPVIVKDAGCQIKYQIQYAFLDV